MSLGKCFSKVNHDLGQTLPPSWPFKLNEMKEKRKDSLLLGSQIQGKEKEEAVNVMLNFLSKLFQQFSPQKQENRVPP